jgi:hypothetical protein
LDAGELAVSAADATRYTYSVVGLQGWEAILHLTNAQADGLACVRCGRPATELGPMDVNAKVYTEGGAFVGTAFRCVAWCEPEVK